MSAVRHCEEIEAALSGLSLCRETEQGALITTHCLYPSFTPVEVFVVRMGDGYIVHDGGGASRAIWDHGRDSGMITHAISQQAKFHQLEVKSGSLVCEVPDSDWLLSAILSVANAASAAARSVLEGMTQAAETDLKDMISDTLHRVVAPKLIATNYALRGNSGKVHHFDFAVTVSSDRSILMDAVAPGSHVSVSSKYVAFSDTKDGLGQTANRLIVHDKPMKAEDVSLLLQVAEIVPFASLETDMKRKIAQ